MELAAKEGIDLSSEQLQALSGGEEDSWDTPCTSKKGCGIK